MAKILHKTWDKVVLEQFLNMQSEEIRLFVRERKPATSEEAGTLADDFLLARRENKSEVEKQSQDSRKANNDKAPRYCQRCGIPGHVAKDCQVKLGKSGEQKDQSAGPRRDLKEVECFNCRKKGHYSSNCPHQAMFCTEGRLLSAIKARLLFKRAANYEYN